MSETLQRIREALGDRYRIEREIGAGGMARVFLAEDPRLGREVAIKVLRPELASSVEAQRFLREIKIVANLNHPHIVPVHDSGEADGLLFYVMPHITGETLAARIRRDGAVPVDETIELLAGLGSALDYAHRQGLVHRDVKPSNVLLSDGHALLADFGIARAIQDSTDTRVTATGFTPGSVHYMSPEQAGGDEDIDGRSDIYSLGCVAFEMLTGSPPFEGSTRSIVVKHISSTPPSLQSRAASLPDRLEAAVAEALEKDPDRRPVTAEAFVAALRGVRAPPRRSERGVVAALGLIGVAAILLVARSLVVGGSSDAMELDPLRVAVLYFDDLSPDQSLRYLSDGLTEALIQELGAVDPLTVISRNGVKPYRDLGIPIDSLAELLGVGHLVEGSVERREGSLIARVRLIEGTTGTEQASEEIVANGGDPLDLRDRIVAQATRFLSQGLGRELQLTQDRMAAHDPDAWALTRTAQTLTEDADQLRWDLGDADAAERALGQADSLLAEAEAFDPDWPEPVALRGWVASQQARLRGSRGTRNEDLLRRGVSHAERLLDRWPASPAGLELRGSLLNDLSWLNSVAADSARSARFQGESEADLRAAVTAEPERAQAWVALADLLRVRGDFSEAAIAAERAVTADPFLIHAEKEILFALTQVWLDLGQVERALEWNDEGLRRYPAEISFTAGKLVVMAGWDGASASPDTAWALVSAGLGGWAPGRLLVAGVLARSGQPDSARAVIAGVRAAGSEDPWLDYYEANTRIQLGEPDRAMDLLESYLEALPSRRSYIARDWWWRPLSARERFVAMVGA
jgi:serine/threonine-protein kinase